MIFSESRFDELRSGRCRSDTRQPRCCSSSASSYVPPRPGEARFTPLFLGLVGGIGGADLLQHGRRQGGDLADELLHVFALHWRGGELQLLALIQEVLVLLPGVEGEA